MAADVLLQTQGLCKRYGGLLATDHVDLDVRAGEIHALIGPNGAGKSTLIGQLSGEIRPDRGHIHFAGRPVTAESVQQRARLGMGRSFQITSIFPDFTVIENVMLASQVGSGSRRRMFGNVRADPALRERSALTLRAVGLDPHADRRAADISHGAQRQLELAIALGSSPRLLLLDEPMAGLGPVESRQMVDVLLGLKKEVTMLLVEHDMDAVFMLADRISVLVYGRIIATGAPDEIRANADVQRAYLGESGGRE
ncbi:MAG: ABC transporter ATP-binding protein [Bordetella sp. SCN 67-23]|nr:ABC transporter ATP-binding protein [Burkholderiales bacterium]ODS74040.1 MAG: ABC transporter ATP-binding protein [Bordetella sp. SCN 67-23]ODU87347.1 MAG: ABC transporter ATP-binding protein [Bordetella sp. SCN 68-11]OJW85968.1 MAG: ABC transporter ATP-binding protein [Burkholderiales bacterium 67-32]